MSTQVGATQESKQQAVQTLVDQALSSAISRQELERQFTMISVTCLLARRTTELRIARIQAVLERRADVTVEFDARAIKTRLKAIDVSEAENFAAAALLSVRLVFYLMKNQASCSTMRC